MVERITYTGDTCGKTTPPSSSSSSSSYIIVVYLLTHLVIIVDTSNSVCNNIHVFVMLFSIYKGGQALHSSHRVQYINRILTHQMI